MANVSKKMVINYVPGEECRVAVMENDRLEEFHAERMDSASHVGNIYIGRVVNVEPAIQAAFIDFGLPANGFLHVTDLHPRYFPGEDQETTERVGKKTPRRERPPIQACLRRGQEVAVQVIKEGVGTKGPTVTSYLSIPGRFLVMMPQMDRVGVSRKVEDEEARRKMREILDQLDLPEGFGFILRTAGMDRTKLELKRDLAYLSRLWKDMEKRWKQGNKPRLLYSESDLLVRTLRDTLTSDMDEIVIDNEAALNRAARFLKIVAPRSGTKLIRYTGKSPIYHALGIEQQIQNIHAREVPLPGGGRLVIDEAEALVAIDVNSGKMRDAKDAETTAYRTNVEAVDEICRQLRLRDVGGVIVNDLIDMRQAKYRREIETRFNDNLKRDRARWTTAPISEFGILEMTRQRMRGSHESQHFADCPVCRGRGLVQRPDSVAADALRELAAILDHEKVARAELVVSPRIAGELLSGKRRALSLLERSLGKHVDVRVSDAIPIDRVSFYAYDALNNDIDVSRLTHDRARPEHLQVFELPADAGPNWAELEAEGVEEIEEPVEEVVELPMHPIEMDDAQAAAAEAAAGPAETPDDDGKRRRTRGGRGRNRDRGGRDGPALPPPSVKGRGRAAEPMRAPDAPSAGPAMAADAQGAPSEGDGEGGRRRRRRRRGGRGRNKDHAPGTQDATSNGFVGNEPGRMAGHDASALHVDGPAREGDFEEPRHGRQPGMVDEPGEPSQSRSPDGAGTDDRSGPEGEGTGGPRPPRRRRRRGGRGRNADHGAVSPDGPHAPHGDSAPRQTHSDESQESVSAIDSSHDHRDDGPSNADHPAAAGEAGPDGPGEAGGTKRRRRRRGGRGRNRAGDEGGGGGGGSVESDAPAPSQTRPASVGGRFPGGGGNPRPPAPIAPASAVPNSPSPVVKVPKPRSLYSSRRRLAPSERKGLGGADE